MGGHQFRVAQDFSGGAGRDGPAQPLGVIRMFGRRIAGFEQKGSTVAARFADRDGGYTRILKLGPRKGDAAPMVIFELVD
mgnify:CR=1 FL=1